ncbi:hypothetical protein I2483_18920 [Sporosarcina sp. E16_3]|uniref:hypothetical protein n=1 Tax=Sporosarcina sp. E16_3 TaxID=2789293 RepID=UPI001A93002E|nr:hypothetical protein [Sporosarcina sp. E16_3]MBO0603740.1 hypothetical protein [Sporosarcina sp. E16_3]
MEVALVTEELTEVQMKKLLGFQKKKKIEAFQLALAEYRDAIGEWDMTNFQDAGPRWREIGALKCDCGKVLRYQYTVTNRLTAEIHNFGIYHLQAETGFSDQVIRGIGKYLNAADREIEEVEQRLKENWRLTFEIPESLELPDELRSTLNDGLPLSKREEKQLSHLVFEAQRQEWRSLPPQRMPISEYERKSINLFGELDFTNDTKPIGPFDLKESEKAFVIGMLESGCSSSMVIAGELHNAGHYTERFLTGRTKLYPLCVFYMDRLVGEGRAVLIQDFGLQDRMYKLAEIK